MRKTQPGWASAEDEILYMCHLLFRVARKLNLRSAPREAPEGVEGQHAERVGDSAARHPWRGRPIVNWHLHDPPPAQEIANLGLIKVSRRMNFGAQKQIHDMRVKSLKPRRH